MAPENGRNDSKLLYPPKADPGKGARAVFQYYMQAFLFYFHSRFQVITRSKHIAPRLTVPL